MALYSLFKITVLCALFHEAAAAATPACSGTRTEANPSSSPDGVYSASSIFVGPGEVNHIDLTFQKQSFNGLQKYHQHLDGCMFSRTDEPMCIPLPAPVDHDYTKGHYVDLGSNQGSMFIPAEQGNFINKLLKIHWCPDQNYFLVKFLGTLLPTLEHHPAAPEYGFVGTDTRCEDNGMETISSIAGCRAAAQSLGYLARDRDGVVETSTYWDRSYGCSWHRFGNVEFWSKGKRDVGCTFRGYAGCMCRIP